MKTSIVSELRDTAEGQIAESIMQKCVHCGLCNANCPTYRLNGDELDGPRGRIYQIKTLFETNQAFEETRLHLDRCLTCRRCETTCPSGVEYAQLADIARHLIEGRLKRSFSAQLLRKSLLHSLPYPRRLKIPLAIAKNIRAYLPSLLQSHIPKKEKPLKQRLDKPINPNGKTVLIPQGCVQSITKPNTLVATQQLLFKLGYRCRILSTDCCGALAYHLAETEAARKQIERNIRNWHQQLQTADYLLITASGCGAMVKDYSHIKNLTTEVADMLDTLSPAVKDLCQILQPEELEEATRLAPPQHQRIVFHAPCSLTNAQGLAGRVEALLTAAGVNLTPFAESDQCCGSAGAYSILQPEFATRIKQQKINHIKAVKPDLVVTANIGCQLFLEGDLQPQVIHWAELLNQRVLLAE